MGQCLNGPYSHWPTPTQRQLQLHRPDVYFALLAVRQRDPLKHLCLCRIAVNRLSQSLHRQFVRDSQRQLADHLPGVRRHQCGPDDLAGPFARVEHREPLLFTINECPLHLRKFQPVCVQGDTLLGRPNRGQANGGYLGVGVGAVRDDQIACRAARSVHSVSNAQPRRRHRRVRVLFRERNVAGSVDGRVARPQGRIGLHAPIPYSYFGGLQPRSSTFALRPMPSRSFSYSSSRVSDWHRTVSRPFAARTALNSKCRRTPSRSNWRRSTSPASGSSFGNRLFLEWTRSTSLPSRRNAWANSLPIGPPPNTTSLRGSSVSEKTVSLVKYSPSRSPSMVGATGREPVAITALLKPSSRPSTATAFGLVKRVWPR